MSRHLRTKSLGSNVNSTKRSNISEDIEHVEKKFDFVTTMMLRKSEYLIEEARSHRSRSKKMNSTKKEHLSTISDVGHVGYSLESKIPQSLKISQQSVESVYDEINNSSNRLKIEDNQYRSSFEHNQSRQKSSSSSSSSPSNYLLTTNPNPTNTPDAHEACFNDSVKPNSSWYKHRVNESTEIKNVMSKSEWENELARHILSVFSTANTGVSIGNNGSLNSEILMEFIDPKHQETREKVIEYVHQSDDTIQRRAARKKSSQSIGGLSHHSREAEISLDRNNSDLMGISFSCEELTSEEKLHGKKLLGDENEASFRHTTAFRRCHVVTNAYGEEVALRGSPHVRPIWFLSSGEVYSDFSGLLTSPHGDHLQAQLSVLIEHCRYKEFIETVGKIISDIWRERNEGEIDVMGILRGNYMKKASSTGAAAAAVASRKSAAIASSSKQKSGKESSQFCFTNNYSQHLSNDDLSHYWKQLILTSNAMAILSGEKNNMETCLNLATLAEQWSCQEGILPSIDRKEVKGCVHDTLAYYFYHKKSYAAALAHAKKSNHYWESISHVEGIATSLIHIAAAQSLLARFKDAHEVVFHDKCHFSSIFCLFC